MKVAIVSNRSPKSRKVADELLKRIKEKNKVAIDYETPNLVISVGGDGTLLKAFHQYKQMLDTVSFLGVHTGHLGFYTDWRDFELEQLVEELCQVCGTDYPTTSYPLLDVEIEYRDEEKEHFVALNESTLRRITSTMVCDVYIREELFENFRGDGISVSTPTGSTAFNKSIGGAVIDPTVRVMQLSEIASLNNRVFRTLGSPMILGGDEWIEARLQETDDYTVTVDHLVISSRNIAAIRYKMSKKNIRFISTRHMPFWNRVRDAFISAVE